MSNVRRSLSFVCVHAIFGIILARPNNLTVNFLLCGLPTHEWGSGDCVAKLCFIVIIEWFDQYNFLFFISLIRPITRCLASADESTKGIYNVGIFKSTFTTVNERVELADVGKT